MDEISLVIPQNLNLDMPRQLDKFFNIKIPVFEDIAGLGAASGVSLFNLIFFGDDSGTRPPPPATALIIMAAPGPREEKNSFASSMETARFFPRRNGHFCPNGGLARLSLITK